MFGSNSLLFVGRSSSMVENGGSRDLHQTDVETVICEVCGDQVLTTDIGSVHPGFFRHSASTME